MSKKRRSKDRHLMLIAEILCILIFVYAALQLFSIFQDYRLASQEYDTLVSQMVIVEELAENKKSEEDMDALVDQYDYKVPAYTVDLDALKMQNSDTIGWIILPDSKINYPIVKSKDNTEYLTTTFEGNTASSGAIFVDMLCNNDFSDENTIIYGHNMKNGSMFRALNNLTDKEYFRKHHIFCIDTGAGFENYEIISCYETVETDLSPGKISFESKEAYGKWLADIANRCTYDCAEYDIDKKTITLSTCRGKSGGPGRFIVHLQKKN